MMPRRDLDDIAMWVLARTLGVAGFSTSALRMLGWHTLLLFWATLISTWYLQSSVQTPSQPVMPVSRIGYASWTPSRSGSTTSWYTVHLAEVASSTTSGDVAKCSLFMFDTRCLVICPRALCSTITCLIWFQGYTAHMDVKRETRLRFSPACR